MLAWFWSDVRSFTASPNPGKLALLVFLFIGITVVATVTWKALWRAMRFVGELRETPGALGKEARRALRSAMRRCNVTLVFAIAIAAWGCVDAIRKFLPTFQSSPAAFAEQSDSILFEDGSGRRNADRWKDSSLRSMVKRLISLRREILSHYPFRDGYSINRGSIVQDKAWTEKLSGDAGCVRALRDNVRLQNAELCLVEVSAKIQQRLNQLDIQASTPPSLLGGDGIGAAAYRPVHSLMFLMIEAAKGRRPP